MDASCACLVTAGGVVGDQQDFGLLLPHHNPHPCSWVGAPAFWGVQLFFGSSWRRGQMSDGPPLESGMRTHSDLDGERGLYVKTQANAYYSTAIEQLISFSLLCRTLVLIFS